MTETWTLSELVAEAGTRLAALPPPKNGQVRAVPDERTIRYYATIGLLDRPAAMRGRTALYGRRHLAQVVAIKRMQSAGHSLADIQRMWSTLDDVTLSRMSGVQIGTAKARAARKEFWRAEAEPQPAPSPSPAPQPRLVPPPSAPRPTSAPTPTITIPLAGQASILIALPEDGAISLSSADLRALRAAAAPLVTELARRGLLAPAKDTLEEP
ncbi:MAG TPA: MerR family transcriptional regulator [Kofleriaceae bacterium]|nr:MerR family transcriptional regulator [Kofleriaceae bacterium]